MAITLVTYPTIVTNAESGDSAFWGIIGGTVPSVRNRTDAISSQSRVRTAFNVSNQGFWFRKTSNVDLSNEGFFSEGSCVGAWVKVKNPGYLASRASGGLSLVVGTDSLNYGVWHVGGNDTISPYDGWRKYWVDLSKAANATVGSGLTKTTAKIFGVRYNNSALADSDYGNIMLDLINYTRPTSVIYTYTGGTTPDPAKFSDIVAVEAFFAMGILTKKEDIYRLNHIIQIGRSADALIFADSDKTISFETGGNTNSYGATLNISLTHVNSRLTLKNIRFIKPLDATVGSIVIGASGGGSGILTDCLFSSLNIVAGAGISYINCVFARQSVIYTGGVFNGSKFIYSTGALSAIAWGFFGGATPDMQGNLDDVTFTSAGTGHAIALDAGCLTTLNIVNHTYNGYASTDGSTGNECIYNNSGKAVTLNILSGDVPTIRNGTGASTTVVVPVTVGVTTKKATDFSVIPNCLVLIESDSGGPAHYNTTVSITSSGLTATVTHTAHGLATGNKVKISGCTQDPYNRVYTITVTGANTYTYTLPSTTTSPATGSPKSTRVILNGLTDSYGELETTWSYKGSQPITGKTRKSSSAPFFRTNRILGSITTAGFSLTQLMVADE